jgi:hypothetical protein
MDNKGMFAQAVVRQVAQNQIGKASFFSFMIRVVEHGGRRSIVKYVGHAIGVFLTSTEIDGFSPLVVFDPNAGVYRVRRGCEALFFEELEQIYGQGNAVCLGSSAMVELIEEAIDFDVTSLIDVEPPQVEGEQ